MSAFLQSGRSDHQKLSEIKVRFRPKAASAASAALCYVAILIHRMNKHLAGS